jgi:lipopolysaccharide export LptBFGC system permease protein LptF
MNAGDFPERAVLLSFFGQHTRYVLSGYIRHTLVVIFAILCVALSIDLVPQSGDVIGSRSGLAATWEVLRFAVLRSADLFPRFIPLAGFLGVLWTEIMLTVSRERILIWNTGRSPTRCLVPVLLLALLFGAVQFAFDAYLRPAAMGVQIAESLGSRGKEFDRHLSPEAHWIASGNDLLLTRFEFGPPPALRDFTLYRLNDSGRLYEVITARAAKPTEEKDIWVVADGSYWEIPPQSAGDVSVLSSEDMKAEAIKFRERRIRLDIDPVWIAVWGIYPEYLSQATLRTLVTRATDKDPRYNFRTRFQANYANALMPGAMALLAASLSLWLFPYAAPLSRQFLTLPFGYAGYLAMKTFALLGEFEYMPPTPAAWAAPFVLFTVSGAILALTEHRRRAGPEPKS